MKTYDEWKAAGFQVARGSKALARNNAGKGLFSIEQLKNSQDPNNGCEDWAQEDYDRFEAEYGHDRDWF